MTGNDDFFAMLHFGQQSADTLSGFTNIHTMHKALSFVYTLYVKQQGNADLQAWIVIRRIRYRALYFLPITAHIFR